MNGTRATPSVGPGILLAVEGIDGAGKTTQVAMLREVLEAVGEAPVTSKEPTDGVWGQKIRRSAAHGRMSLEDELEAFKQDRREHVDQLIQPALDAGRIVILDRYFYSTIAYQGSRGADIPELRADMEALFPIPDLVFLLDVDPSLGLHRVSHERGDVPNEFERIEGLTKARSVFLEVAKTRPSVNVLDGAQTPPAVHAELLRCLVDGPLKAKRCAEDRGCTDPSHTNPALADNCDWFRLSRRLLATLSQPAGPDS